MRELRDRGLSCTKNQPGGITAGGGGGGKKGGQAGIISVGLREQEVLRQVEVGGGGGQAGI